MNAQVMNAYEKYVKEIKEGMDSYLSSMDKEALIEAMNLILEAKKKGNRIHISGIGKPAHVAGYIASLMSSTGTPTYFLHGTEAVHGSCGQLIAGDIVIFISNSGETAEMRSTIIAIKKNKCKVIGVSRNTESWLAKESDVHLLANYEYEGGPLNRAPRMSILAETAILQALSVMLQAYEDITPQQYVCWHPGGTLGQIRDNEK